METFGGYRLYVGSYTAHPGDAGIYLVDVDPVRRACTVAQTNDETENPSFLLLSNGRLFAANEQGDCARFSSFAIEDGGALRLVDSFRAAGAGTCHIALDPTGARIYGANYESGSIVGCRVRADGAFEPGFRPVAHRGSGVVAERQDGPHVHMVGFAPHASSLLAVDLGIDALVSYAVLPDGSLEEASGFVLPVAAGEGPRMLAHHPVLPLTVLVTELGNRVVLFRREGAGLPSWRFLASHSVKPTGFSDGECLAAHALFSPDGRYLYVSVRGPNEIRVFSVGQREALELRSRHSSGGSWPRHMALSDDGFMLAVANERSDEVVVFAIDRASGALGNKIARCPITRPSCVVWA